MHELPPQTPETCQDTEPADADRSAYVDAFLERRRPEIVYYRMKWNNDKIALACWAGGMLFLRAEKPKQAGVTRRAIAALQRRAGRAGLRVVVQQKGAFPDPGEVAMALVADAVC